MGLLQNKPEDLAAKARQAYDDGRQRFAVRLLDLPSAKDDEVDSWSRHIEAIEATGWIVDHFSTVPSDRGWNHGYVLFMRR
ncbi:hypothetical protein HUO13_01260 [Saccharopolyspora erythraea]|uniref:hypothetical protein n=1 Tax=Saccharopolyspora erythraea TaxID=1836 RepID=UPI001BA8A2AA|nr:hypothetical protein [Saccharopolyspora erythraea]QUG99605.1 hypothetical protein HUO13_01260 [Saccharopolyspora erythraea]